MTPNSDKQVLCKTGCDTKWMFFVVFGSLCRWLSLSGHPHNNTIWSGLQLKKTFCGCGEEFSVSAYISTSQSSIWGRHWKHFDSTQEASSITMIKAMLTTILIAVITAVSEAKWAAMLHAMREAILLAVHNAMRDAVSIAVRSAMPEASPIARLHATQEASLIAVNYAVRVVLQATSTSAYCNA